MSFSADVADDGEEPDSCMQGSCSKKVCGFDFSWVYDAESDTITFTISAKYVARDQWLALGFSEDVNMVSKGAGHALRCWRADRHIHTPPTHTHMIEMEDKECVELLKIERWLLRKRP